MRALSLKSADGLDAVTIEQVTTPEPAAGEVRVAIKAASLNHRELWIAKGAYPGMQLPATLGCDGAGVVEAVGEGVDAGLIGQSVMLYPGLDWGDNPAFPTADFGLLGMPGPGTVADSICVRADRIVPKPDHLDFAQAAAIPLGGLTAWRGLVTKGAITAADHVLITGIGGGVATFALLFATAFGAKAYVTSGSDETLAKAQAIGASGGINYKSEKWSKPLGAMSGGIDLVFDGAPAGGYANYGRVLNMGARVVVYGSTGGMSFPLNAPELFLKNVTLKGTNVGNLQEFKDMVAFVAEHRIVPVIDRIFPIDAAKDALSYLKGHEFGKVVITI